MMTWLLAAFLSTFWLITTWFSLPNYVPTVTTDTWSTEYEVNLIEVQKEIIIEDYFTFADRFPKIKYARWCAWGYEPGVRNASGRIMHCSKTAFDCWGIMKAYLYVKWIISAREMTLLRSDTLYALGDNKSPYLAQRWDFMYWRWYGSASTWNMSTHFSVLSRDYSGGNTMWIYDNVKPGRPNWFGERQIKVSCNKNMCYSLWKYKIYIANNWAVELAATKWVIVDPFVRVDTWATLTWKVETVVTTIEQKPAVFLSGKASWYDYDLKWVKWSKSHNTCALRIKERYKNYKVCNADNGKCVVCYQNDYGPKEYTNKVIDLSSHAFAQIADKSRWVANVLIYKM